MDCVGLVVIALTRSGLVLTDETRYGREPWDDQLRKRLREKFNEPVSDWQPGDIALIRWRKDEPSHIGILADHPDGGLSLIHASNLQGVVECSLTGPYLKCVEEVYRPWHSKY